ncbi:hypothetical protein AYO39_02265 [Actinobacteria bacterium SCGC AG-212-D09]|nr:hypothetical protein AYO39_02265 [Actinobacteria bacterium SCGC AG-212-D09]
MAANFTLLQTLLNGNLDSTNLGATAGITLGQLAAGVGRMTATASSAGTVTAADGQILFLTGTAQTVNLPAVSGGVTLAVMALNTGLTGATTHSIHSGGANVNYVGQVGTGTGIFLGTPGARLVFYSDGGSWFVISGQQDTGWVPLALTANFIAAGGVYTPAVRLQGDVVRLKGGVQNNTGGAFTSGTFATIGVGLRPTAPLPGWFVSVTGTTSPYLINTGAAGGIVLDSGSWANGAILGLDGLSYTLT